MQIDHKFFQPWHAELLASKKYYTFSNIIFFGGAGSGKSLGKAREAVLSTFEGHNWQICRVTYGAAKLSCFTECEKALKDMQMTQHFKINRGGSSPKIINLLTGYGLYFFGLEKPDKIFSIVPEKGVWTDQWFEEATEMSKGAVDKIDTRLRGAAQGQEKIKKRRHYTFNPIEKNHWLKKNFMSHFEIKDKEYWDDNTYILHTTHHDNLYLTDEDHERYENYKNMSSYMYNVYCLGLWGTIGEKAFDSIIKANIPEEEMDKLKPLDGLDWGHYPDPTQMTRSSLDYEGNLYTYKEFGGQKLMEEKIAKKLEEWDSEHIYCDSADPARIQRLNILGAMALSAKKPKNHRSNFVDYINNHKWYIDPNKCPTLFAQATSYCREKDKNEEIVPNKFEDGNDHAIDATMYGTEVEIANMIPLDQRKYYKAFNCFW
jgi:phage terminase large subunit